MKIKEFIEDLKKLLDQYDVQLNGQLLISEKEFPHEIVHEKQAKWGQFNVRDKQAIVIHEKRPPHKPIEFKKQRAPNVISDDLGLKGVLNHADGKLYDSKSEYKKSVKEAGLEILGNDAPRDCKPAEPKIDMNDLKRDIAQSIQQLGG